MKRVSSTSKGITNANQPSNIAVPSLQNPEKKDNFKPIPNLNNFIKSNVVFELNSRKKGIYKLKKYETGWPDGLGRDTRLLLSYKLGKTSYKIHAFALVRRKGNRPAGRENLEGSIKISKGLFNTKKFKLNELPTNIVTSINQNITKFNEEYGEVLLSKEEKVKIKVVKKKTKFFEGLDI